MFIIIRFIKCSFNKARLNFAISCTEQFYSPPVGSGGVFENFTESYLPLATYSLGKSLQTSHSMFLQVKPLVCSYFPLTCMPHAYV